MTGTGSGQDLVLCIHGLARTPLSFRTLRTHLQDAGFATACWSYRSWRKPIEDHALALRARLLQLQADPQIPRFHVVTHSMGGIVLRCALYAAVPKKLARVVMVAPPNAGSPWARVLSPVLGWLYDRA